MITIGLGTARSGSGVTRRDLLRVGGLAALGLSLGERESAALETVDNDRAVILLMLVGGPSQLESFDPKPDAPTEVRGPFRSIATAVPGVRLCEHLPRLAARMRQVTLLRSLHHDAAPIHETGHQLIQTGRLCREEQEPPHVGSVVSRLQGMRGDLPPFVVVPAAIGNTGVSVSHGQAAGILGQEFDPFVVAADPASPTYDSDQLFERARQHVAHFKNPRSLSSRRVRALPADSAFALEGECEAVRDAYGRTTFGQSCLLARRLVESGVRLVTVNMYESVFNRVTWDCHGISPFSTLDDYARDVLPTFDLAFSALLDDLKRRDMLGSTLVVATGEFGRTPRLNPAGGRDHWPGVWSAVLAGGGTHGGQVVGASDDRAGAPADRPVRPADLVATIYRSLGISADRTINSAAGEPLALVDGAEPISELFA